MQYRTYNKYASDDIVTEIKDKMIFYYVVNSFSRILSIKHQG